MFASGPDGNAPGIGWRPTGRTVALLHGHGDRELRRVAAAPPQQFADLQSQAGADDPAWSAEERSVLRVVDELIRTCELTDPAWKELVEHYSTNQILDILALLGQHSMMAIVFNAIGLRSEPQFKEFALDGS